MTSGSCLALATLAGVDGGGLGGLGHPYPPPPAVGVALPQLQLYFFSCDPPSCVPNQIVNYLGI